MSISIIALLFVVSVGIVSVPARSQVTSRPGVVRTGLDRGLRFDMVSIKRSRGDRGPSYRILPNRFHSTGVPLRTILLMAYFPIPLWGDQRIQGAPSWVNNQLYDIEARVAPEDLAAWQSKKQNIVYKGMLEKELRNMLQERCKLVVHMVPAQATGYDLLVSGRGRSFNTVDYRSIIAIRVTDAIA